MYLKYAASGNWQGLDNPHNSSGDEGKLAHQGRAVDTQGGAEGLCTATLSPSLGHILIALQRCTGFLFLGDAECRWRRGDGWLVIDGAGKQWPGRGTLTWSPLWPKSRESLTGAQGAGFALAWLPLISTGFSIIQSWCRRSEECPVLRSIRDSGRSHWRESCPEKSSPGGGCWRMRSFLGL